MKLFIVNNQKMKIYLNLTAKSRTELMSKLGDEFFTVSGDVFTVWDVDAEPDSGSIGASAVIGGIVGLIGGPIGALIGCALGAKIGNSQDNMEKEKVEFFNES